MKQYVLGFYFSTDKKFVTLIKKNRPVEYAGKLNGVGGKVEENEEPLHAMIREFFEEAGLMIHDWDNFCRFKSHNYDIYVYRSFGDKLPQTMTDEVVMWYPVESVVGTITGFETFDSFKWLLPMALDVDVISSIVVKSR